MPAKTKKKPATSRTRSTVTKSNKVLSTKVNKKRVLITIAILSIIGAFFMFRASAATTNFEAEAGTLNNLATIGSDTTASGGKYVTFAQPTTTTTTTNSTQRFPGDPNPLKTGKTYWGAAIGGNDDPVARHETPTGKSLSLHRTFSSSWQANGSGMVTRAKDDLAHNRLPWVSTKSIGGASGWAKMGNGTYDNEIDGMLIALDNIGGKDKPVWLTVNHEPENDGGNAADWRAMQTRIRQRMNALKAQGKPMDNIAFIPILMDYTFDPYSKRNPEDWWVDGIWDASGIDPYCYESCSSKGKFILDSVGWKNYLKFAASKKLPIAIGEWGDTSTIQVQATNINKFWEFAFIPGSEQDIVGYSEFDSGLNPPSGTTVDTTLHGVALDAFQNILKNDQRVMRLDQLNSNNGGAIITTSYGKITAKVTLPENGAYKVWARMKAADVNNNAAQLQIDNGVATNIGGSSVSATSWTWVSLPAANLAAGTRTLNLTGIQKGVKVDRVILTNETCIPEGTGDLCAIATPPPPVSPDVTVGGITNGQTISGVVPITVSSTGTINEVTFRPDNVWDATDATAPYTYNWDTTKYPNGTHTFVTRTRFAGDPGGKYTQNTTSVTIKNSTSSPTSPTQPADTTPPAKPTDLRASLVFDWSKLKYVMNLKWSGSYDNVGTTKYIITSNGKKLGESTSTTYTDASNLTAGTAYTYGVSATDAAGNVSNATNLTMVTQCVFISCTATVQ